jgi:Zn-dependent protease
LSTQSETTSPAPEQPSGGRAQTARGARGARGTIAAIVLAVLAKGKTLLIALKGLKLAKLFLTFGSMMAMIAFEATRSGWLFGVGFVLLILVHELGHGWAIKREGLAAGYPVFIPFLGAMISLRGQPRSSLVEARIALAGPLAGTLGALAVTAIFFLTHQRIWLALAYSGFVLNLFNLTPFAPLDGGRVARMFSRRLWIVGVVVLGGMFLLTSAPQILFIGVLGLGQIMRGAPSAAPGEAEVTPAQRQVMAAHYFGLCAFLAAGTLLAGRLLGS